MSVERRRIWALGAVGACLVGLVLALMLTPLGGWASSAVGFVWQRFVDLPGLAWLRTEMGSAEGGDRAAGDTDPDAIRDILREGLSLKKEGAYEEALKRYRQALKLDERYAPTHVALAELYVELGQEEKAVKELEQAASLAPEDARIFMRLGALYMDRDEMDKAVAVLTHARDLAPDDSGVLYMLGVARAYRSYLDAREAVEVLEYAAQLDTDNPRAHFQLAQAYVRRHDAGDLPRAIDALKRTLELDSAQTDAYYYLGQLYLQTAQPEEAIAAWERYVAESEDEETVAQVRHWLENLKDQVRP